MTTFRDDMPLVEARDRLRELVQDGHKCPCCAQLAKVYRRPLTAVAGAALIALHREVGRGYGHMPTIAQERLPRYAHQGGYLTLGQHWGLIEEASEPREDGGRAGWWRLTIKGGAFVFGQWSVSKYVHLYDGRLLRHSGPLVGIDEVLGRRFDYAELMHG